MKHQVASKIGRAEDTVDMQFKQENDRFKANHKVYKDLSKSLRKYFSVLKELHQTHSAIAECFGRIYENQEGMWDVIQKSQAAQIEMDQMRINLENQINDDVFIPMSEYKGQYKIMNDRCNEREKRRIDMDRFRTEVKNLTEKPHKDASKLPNAQSKYNAARAGYEELNKEVIRDMNLLYQDRVCFTDPILATFFGAQTTYYEVSSQQLGSVSHLVSHIDKTAIHRHARVISEVSVAQTTVAVAAPASSAYPPSSTHPTYTSTTAPASQPGSYTTQTTTTYVASYQTTPVQSPPYQSAPVQSGPPARPQSIVQSAPAKRYAVALYPFTAQNPVELSFNYGDRIAIISQQGEWWTGELNGKQGLIPSNYVQMQ